MQTLSVLIASRLARSVQPQPDGILFIETAIQSVQAQTAVKNLRLQIVIGVDRGSVPPAKDFATMSGWLMPRSIWAAIGPFNESYRWHLDNEWLGHLARKNAARCHLVEKDVPLEGVRLAHERPELATLLKHSLGKVELVGHGISWSLVRRRVHAGLGLAQIRSDPTIKAESRHEFQRLIEEYGRLSW